MADGGFDPYEFTDAVSPSFPSGGDAVNHTSASFHFETTGPAFLRLMPLGDSITYGSFGTKAGYREALKGLLDEAEVPFQFVGSVPEHYAGLPRDQRHQEGHPGFREALRICSR